MLSIWTRSSFVVWEWVNSLPNDKILDWSNLKAFADDKVDMTKKLKSGMGWVKS